MITLCDQYFDVQGYEVELGSGAGFFKEMRPNVLTSDVREGLHYDLTLDAQNMNLQDQSVRCIYAINVFHHLPKPTRFFDELRRVLVPGGGCILVEPHAGFGSAFLHRRLHKDEFFEPEAPEWSNEQIQGPLSGANQALAHIIFARDLEKFNARYGNELTLVHQQYCTNGLRYLLSGGLNFRQLLPSFLNPVLGTIERIASPLARYWSLHQISVIRRY